MRVNQVLQAVALYDIQRSYGERLRGFSTQRLIRQRQEDTVKISKDGIKMLESLRKKKEPMPEITYSNPQIDNVAVNNTLFEPVAG